MAHMGLNSMSFKWISDKGIWYWAPAIPAPWSLFSPTHPELLKIPTALKGFPFIVQEALGGLVSNAYQKGLVFSQQKQTRSVDAWSFSSFPLRKERVKSVDDYDETVFLGHIRVYVNEFSSWDSQVRPARDQLPGIPACTKRWCKPYLRTLAVGGCWETGNRFSPKIQLWFSRWLSTVRMLAVLSGLHWWKKGHRKLGGRVDGAEGGIGVEGEEGTLWLKHSTCMYQILRSLKKKQ